MRLNAQHVLHVLCHVLASQSYALQAQHALGGNLERIKRVVRLGGFVNVTAGYTAIAPVMNGCSDFIVCYAPFYVQLQPMHAPAGQSHGGKRPPCSRSCR
jgi:hypothetical protein